MRNSGSGTVATSVGGNTGRACATSTVAPPLPHCFIRRSPDAISRPRVQAGQRHSGADSPWCAQQQEAAPRPVTVPMAKPHDCHASSHATSNAEERSVRPTTYPL
jgi:hypothetical protein